MNSMCRHCCCKPYMKVPLEILYHKSTANATKFLFCCVCQLHIKTAVGVPLPNPSPGSPLPRSCRRSLHKPCVRLSRNKISVVVSFGFLTACSFPQICRDQHITSRPRCQLNFRPAKVRRRYRNCSCWPEVAANYLNT